MFSIFTYTVNLKYFQSFGAVSQKLTRFLYAILSCTDVTSKKSRNIFSLTWKLVLCDILNTKDIMNETDFKITIKNR